MSRNRPAIWIAWLIIAVGVIGIILGLINNGLGDTPGSFLSFSAQQIFWLGVLWTIVGILLLFLLPPIEQQTVDLSGVNRLETQVRGFEGRFSDLNARVDSRLGDLNTRLGSLDTRVGDVDTRFRSFQAGPAAPKIPYREDQLEVIEGIGPKIEAALKSAGIGTFAAVAAASETDLRAALERSGINFAPSINTWARQAQLLVDGDLEGFENLTKQLTAGRNK
jgi:hypothetical protein